VPLANITPSVGTPKEKNPSVNGALFGISLQPPNVE